MEQKLKQVIIEMPEELHKEIKIRAAYRNMTMKAWIIRAILDAIAQEQKYE